jgi:hypothetical protein
VVVNAFSGAQLRYYDLLTEVGISPLESDSDEPLRLRVLNEMKHAKDVYIVEVYELPLDYWCSTETTFWNRFSASTELYRPGGPVILYDVGEATAFGYDLTFITKFQNQTSRLRQVASELGGIMVQLEHRFYGKSAPYNITQDLPASAFEFLTTDQALADVATFAWNFLRLEFPGDEYPVSLPNWPMAEETTIRFRGWEIAPSNTFWTGGEFDPWRTLSVLSDEESSPKYAIQYDIPECGEDSRNGSKVFGHLLANAQHTFDLRLAFKPADPI